MSISQNFLSDLHAGVKLKLSCAVYTVAIESQQSYFKLKIYKTVRHGRRYGNKPQQWQQDMLTVLF